MPQLSFFKQRLYVTLVVTVAIWILLLWDFYHGGVPSHHILQNKDLPKFSNWWGGLLLPLLTWFLLYRSQVRIEKESTSKVFPTRFVTHFVGALFFGIVLSVFFLLGNQDVPFYMLVGLLVFAFFFPIYRAECLLGFVLGMTYTFGGVLPIIIGTVLVLITGAIYLLLLPILRFIWSRVIKLFNS
ncbi:hypothetical protein BXU11_08345 [Flavobacterium sp. LM5]|uniref:hypothetical protein n=1 Tax=Flavobacterium sp. LM5 TaxID=1938610 RepID=UPI000994637B|nr:hypothetical protein [Flavobacterium sp. LM5]OOV29859.1 hypothetical protein BXU11_08345 [Flavobacterium sp. LM5]